MAQGVAGFIDYDPGGKPFMGLLVTDGAIEVKIYLSHREGAYAVVGELTRQLKAMATDIIKMPDKLAVVGGSDGKVQGLQVVAWRRPVPHPAGSIPRRAGSARPQGTPAAGEPPVRTGKGTGPENNLLECTRQVVLSEITW